MQMKKENNGFPAVELQIPVSTAELPEFLQLFQRGVILKGDRGRLLLRKRVSVS